MRVLIIDNNDLYFIEALIDNAILNPSQEPFKIDEDGYYYKLETLESEDEEREKNQIEIFSVIFSVEYSILEMNEKT